MSEPTEQEYLEDNIATVAFHLGQPGARISVQNGDLCGLIVEPGEVLKEVSRRIESHGALVKALQDIKAATLNGSVCDDVAWFGLGETLHDFCERTLGAVGIAGDTP